MYEFDIIGMYYHVNLWSIHVKLIGLISNYKLTNRNSIKIYFSKVFLFRIKDYDFDEILHEFGKVHHSSPYFF